MPDRWTLTLRDGPHVTRMHFASAAETIDAMERQMDELAPAARRRSIQIAGRRFDASRQVAVRGEVVGPGGMFGGPRGGIDMRGDGSAEAYLGRLRRTLLELQPGETPYEGLRRALREQGDS